MIDNILKSDFCVFANPYMFIFRVDGVEKCFSIRYLVRWAKRNSRKADRERLAKEQAMTLMNCYTGKAKKRTIAKATEDLTGYCYALLENPYNK